jgi:hypothetical protein
MHTKELNMAKQEKSPRTRLSAGLKAAFAVVAIGAAALFGGCENETNSTPEVAYNVYLGTKQIRVEDTTGLVSKADIEVALASMDSTTDNCVVHFKAMTTSPVMVIENIHNLRVEDNKFFIGIDRINQNGIESAIYEAIIYIYNDGSIPLMSKLSNKEVNVSNAEVPGTKPLHPSPFLLG